MLKTEIMKSGLKISKQVDYEWCGGINRYEEITGTTDSAGTLRSVRG